MEGIVPGSHSVSFVEPSSTKSRRIPATRERPSDHQAQRLKPADRQTAAQSMRLNRDPGPRHDRDTEVACQSHVSSIAVSKHEKHPDTQSKTDAPPAVDAKNLPDMGRPNGT